MMKYNFENGCAMLVKDNEIVVPQDIDKMFKVNLPATKDEYETGNGEGVWACATASDTEKVFSDCEYEIIFVKILNDSLYYPGLKCYDIIPVELRGECRPVAMFNELQYHYNKDGDENTTKNNKNAIITDLIKKNLEDDE